MQNKIRISDKAKGCNGETVSAHVCELYIYIYISGFCQTKA